MQGLPTILKIYPINLESSLSDRRFYLVYETGRMIQSYNKEFLILADVNIKTIHIIIPATNNKTVSVQDRR